ncbi:uncharacterized protein ACNLHF_021275 [Anomaloglossus baeobatrachus]
MTDSEQQIGKRFEFINYFVKGATVTYWQRDSAAAQDVYSRSLQCSAAVSYILVVQSVVEARPVQWSCPCVRWVEYSVPGLRCSAAVSYSLVVQSVVEARPVQWSCPCVRWVEYSVPGLRCSAAVSYSLVVQSVASTSRAHDRAPPRPSQGRRRGGGGHSASQRAPDSDGEEAGCINIDLLIDEVREREPLWNMADRRHADTIVTRRLWDEVCHAAIEGWEELNSRAQKKARDKLQKRWRSIRDHFKKELNQEMQAPSGSGGRRSKYRYFRALSFLRTTMVCRSTVCSTREPASNPSGAIPAQSATGEHRHRPHPSEPPLSSNTSVPSTCAGASDNNYDESNLLKRQF